MPSPGRCRAGYFYKTGYLVKADTLAGLAEKLGIDPDGLAATVSLNSTPRRNAARIRRSAGVPPSTTISAETWTTSPTRTWPRWAKARLAAKIQMGDLGTFAGVGVNENSEATTAEGAAIPGLLAVGAAAVSVFGGGYPGYGSHIGPALVFGYRAGRDVAMLAAARGVDRAATVEVG